MLRLHAAARLLAAAHRRQRQGRGGGGGPLRGDVVPRHEERRLASTSQSCRFNPWLSTPFTFDEFYLIISISFSATSKLLHIRAVYNRYSYLHH